MRLLAFLLVMLLLLPVPFFNHNKPKKLHDTNSKLYIAKVANNISVGPFTGNKSLALGVGNILAEVGQDKGLELVDDPVDADIAMVVELVYLDIEQSKSNVSVFHKDENSVIIRMRGTTYDGLGKKIQSILVQEKSTETSTSTFLINEGGQFNSQVARQAVKKTCVSLANKLL